MTNQTIGDLAESWIDLRVRSQSIAELTERNYRRSLSSFVDAVGADCLIGDVTPFDIEMWIAGPKDGPRLLGSTMNTRSAPVRTFFAWACARGFCAADPCLTIPRAKTTTRSYPLALPAASVRRILLAAGFRDRVMILLGLHLGLRVSEIAKLKVASWDRDEGTMLVHGKGDRMDKLPVSAELDEVLGFWVEMMPDSSGPLFPSRQGGNEVLPNNVSCILRSAFRRAGIEAKPHALRHTFGTELVRSGVPINVVQRLMRHRTLNTTQIYVMASDDELRAAVEGRSHLSGW